jgi:lipoprotein-anchoring transpeptidase ErfK/SrfK
MFWCFNAASAAHGASLQEAAMSKLEVLRGIQADKLQPEEFWSVEAVIRKAAGLVEGGGREEAEKQYQLAYAKAALLERHIDGRTTQKKDATLPGLKTGGSAESSVVTSRVGMPGLPGAAHSLPPVPQTPEKTETLSKQSELLKAAAVEASDAAKTGASTESGSAELLIDTVNSYVVKKQDTLKLVSAKTGVSPQVIAKDNGLDPKKPLQPGKILRITTRKIVPRPIADGIVINIPERTLYLFKEGKLYVTFPVGLGMTKASPLSSWRTPTGKFTITAKAKDPAWYVPPSIQQQLKSQGKTPPTVVPPGPRNPLGKFALRTSFDGILIHGTLAPASIGKFSSHGCVRMLSRDIESLFKTVKLKTDGEFLYQPVKVAVSDGGRVFLEAHADAYNKVRDLESEAKRLLQEKNAADRVDWKKVKSLLKSGSGRVEEVSL